MRHNRKFNHLGRKSDHRKAMLANMAASLIIHKKIKTTVAKAKALRTYVEPLITKSKEDSTHSRRIVFGYLQNKNAVSELFREISPKIMERPGGYTRILKIGNRAGDNAEMCIIELVDYNENLLTAKAEATAKTGKRRRRGAGKKKEEVDAQKTKEEVETRSPKEEADAQEPKEEVETKAPKEEADAQKPKEEVETKAPKEEVDVKEQTDEVQDTPSEMQSETPEIKNKETRPDKEETPEEVADSAEESTPEDIPEAKDEKKPDDKKE